MARPRSTGQGNGKWASSLAEVKQLALMHITAPSGAKFTLRAVTLDELFAEEAVPEHLVHVALLNMQPGGFVRRMAQHVADGDQEQADKLSRDNLSLRDRMVLRAVVDPVLAETDLAELDPYDKAMIAQLSQRVTDMDAEGKKVGADSLDGFRRACVELAGGEADEARRKVLLELAEVQ